MMDVFQYILSDETGAAIIWQQTLQLRESLSIAGGIPGLLSECHPVADYEELSKVPIRESMDYKTKIQPLEHM